MKMHIKTMHPSKKKVTWENDSQSMVRNCDTVINYKKEFYVN